MPVKILAAHASPLTLIAFEKALAAAIKAGATTPPTHLITGTAADAVAATELLCDPTRPGQGPNPYAGVYDLHMNENLDLAGEFMIAHVPLGTSADDIDKAVLAKLESA